MAISKKDVMKEIYKYFKKDKKMVLLAGDMGFAVLDDFFNNHANRTFNTGITEQATIGIAAGMEMVGMKPIVYSQIPFLVMRSFEQIRYDVCEHNLNIKMIGVGADNYFKALGRSHCMDKDDVYLMSLFKNLLILDPDESSLVEDIKKMFTYDGPVYVRTL
ncbi:transketolase [Halarcobacter ebronensis]|uniref:Transketolase n=1 Tax=Halarcobacter ebronensis TaxID=1462615 RepID=A0A4Q1ANG9_9BACT|nr:transketolase [Halarcobacter ebronensis]QKF83317.1 transketolase [Halarcobacter ebronensis]RXK05879.1 transketolase [Halarcobacter ebronensis]